MSHADALAVALTLIPGWRASDVVVLDELGGGPASTSRLIEYRGQRFVLRLDTSMAGKIGLDRPGEIATHRAAADAGLAPKIEFALPEQGLLLTHYVAGRTWQAKDLLERGQLATLAQLLRRLHALAPAVRAFDLRGALQRYAQRIDTSEARQWAREGEALLDQVSGRERRLCHNDVIAQNIVQGNRLWLIDWEYAALGDPLFDLGVIISHHRLSRATADVLLGPYLEDLDVRNNAARETVDIYCKFYVRLRALWQGVTMI